jgi:hypothetical protein
MPCWKWIWVFYLSVVDEWQKVSSHNQEVSKGIKLMVTSPTQCRMNMFFHSNFQYNNIYISFLAFWLYEGESECKGNFLINAVTRTERSWRIAQYWQCLLKSSAICSTALCLQSSGSNKGENMDTPLQDCSIEEQRALCGFFGQEEWNLWKFAVVCWLNMDRAPWANEKFISGWKGLNRVKHLLLMKVVVVGHQHHPQKTTSTRQMPWLEKTDNNVWSGCTFGLCRKMICKIAHSYFYYSH